VRIRAVYLWQNGMLMVFGQDGQQMPEFQGPVETVGERVAELFPRELWVEADFNELFPSRHVKCELAQETTPC
jgi:hypothetical protein